MLNFRARAHNRTRNRLILLRLQIPRSCHGVEHGREYYNAPIPGPSPNYGGREN